MVQQQAAPPASPEPGDVSPPGHASPDERHSPKHEHNLRTNPNTTFYKLSDTPATDPVKKNRTCRARRPKLKTAYKVPEESAYEQIDFSAWAEDVGIEQPNATYVRKHFADEVSSTDDEDGGTSMRRSRKKKKSYDKRGKKRGGGSDGGTGAPGLMGSSGSTWRSETEEDQPFGWLGRRAREESATAFESTGEKLCGERQRELMKNEEIVAVTAELHSWLVNDAGQATSADIAEKLDELLEQVAKTAFATWNLDILTQQAAQTFKAKRHLAVCNANYLRELQMHRYKENMPSKENDIPLSEMAKLEGGKIFFDAIEMFSPEDQELIRLMINERCHQLGLYNPITQAQKGDSEEGRTSLGTVGKDLLQIFCKMVINCKMLRQGDTTWSDEDRRTPYYIISS